MANSKIRYIYHRLNYKEINTAFTFACFFLPTAFGSTVSFVFLGGAIWCAKEIIIGNRDLSTDHAMIYISSALYAFCAINVFSTILNAESYSDIYSLIPLATFLFFPFSYSIWTISDKALITRYCILGSMGACYSGVLIAVVQFHVWGLRAEGGAGNASVFAIVVSLAGAVSLAGVFLESRKLAMPLMGAYLASLISVVYAGTRMAWASTIVTTVAILWINRHRFSLLRSPRIFYPGMILLSASALLTYDVVYWRLLAAVADWRKIELLGNLDTSLGQRIALWETGLKLFWEHPFTGHGLAATKVLVAQGLKEQGLDLSFSHFHNGFLTIAIESGALGLVAITAVFVAAAVIGQKALLQSRNPTQIFGAILLVIAVLTYLVSGITNLIIGHDILDTVLMIFLIVGTYLASGTSLSGTHEDSSRSQMRTALT